MSDPGLAGHTSDQPRPKLVQLSVELLLPSPENLQLYRPVEPTDPEIVAMAESMRRNGVLQPLVVTEDGYILSGHRRHCAAQLAGLRQIPCTVVPIRRDSDPDGFMRLLREHNRQRDKTLDEKLREEIVSVNPDEAALAVYEYRREKAAVKVETLKVRQPALVYARGAARYVFWLLSRLDAIANQPY